LQTTKKSEKLKDAERGGLLVRGKRRTLLKISLNILECYKSSKTQVHIR